MQEQAHAAGTRSHRDGSPTGRPRVVVIGDALVDEVVVDGTTTRHPGGSALNVAIGLAIPGVPATLLTSIGED
ncbi:MAG: hypothetical protein J7484_13095, partial [Microbacterium sp.]|nr:hypothetical protein [Microbacterium sp.]